MDDRIEVKLDTVQNLIKDQFPTWSNLAICPVEQSGWDNRTFHLGDGMVMRFPSAERYANQVEKDYHWLPIIGAAISYDIPSPIAIGKPDHGYPFKWSIFRWIDGTTADTVRNLDLGQFALDLSKFLLELQTLNTMAAPQPGSENFYRGDSPRVYHDEMINALEVFPVEFDREIYLEAWQILSQSTWNKPAVWIHGDLTPTNILVREGRFSAVIDFGQMAVGDPACDYSIAWQFLSKSARAIFKQSLAIDNATWDRAAAWALWKASIRVSGLVTSTPKQLSEAESTLSKIMDDLTSNLIG